MAWEIRNFEPVYVDDKKPTWADIRYGELMDKGRDNWDEDDWEAYCYIQECWAEDYADEEYFDNYSIY